MEEILLVTTIVANVFSIISNYDKVIKILKKAFAEVKKREDAPSSVLAISIKQ
jgi:hypothetical protein